MSVKKGEAVPDTAAPYPNWEKRLGLKKSGLLVSPSFTLTKRGKETYLASRDDKDMKLSLHSSRIHRLAEVGVGPREPFSASTLGELIPGQWRTVVRIIYTSETSILPSFTTENIRYWLPLSFDRRLQAVQYTIGFTCLHPDDHPDTRLAGNIFTGQIADDKFLTVTENRNSRRNALIHCTPRLGTSIRHYMIYGIPTSYSIFTYSSDKWTYIYWVHCGISLENRSRWWKKSDLFRTLAQADPGFERLMSGS